MLIFSKNHFDIFSFAEMSSEMMMLIRKRFIENLDDLDWLDQETRSYAKRKASDIVDNIGYPGGRFNQVTLIFHKNFAGDPESMISWI